MNDAEQETASAAEEQDYLRRSLKRIVIGQEIGPRTPRWRTAWKRTLFKYANRWSQLNTQSPPRDQAE